MVSVESGGQSNHHLFQIALIFCEHPVKIDEMPEKPCKKTWVDCKCQPILDLQKPSTSTKTN